VRKSGKAAGILAPTPARATGYLAQGANFVAVGSDTTLLTRAATELLAKFKSSPSKGSPAPSAY
jgi:4-hydroxy-2-oxoheptanedioate aldolase